MVKDTNGKVVDEIHGLAICQYDGRPLSIDLAAILIGKHAKMQITNPLSRLKVNCQNSIAMLQLDG